MRCEQITSLSDVLIEFDLGSLGLIFLDVAGLCEGVIIVVIEDVLLLGLPLVLGV